MESGQSKLRIAGRVRYYGGSPTTVYVTKFYYWYIFGPYGGDENRLRGTFVKALNPKYNEYT